MEELVLQMEEGIFLPDIIAEENKRRNDEETRIANEQERIANEQERIANEKIRQEIAENIENKLMFYKKYEQTYTTTAINEQEINIDIPEYNKNTILFVTVNGIDLIENEDYKVFLKSGSTIIGGGTVENYYIKLTTPITTIRTKVHFLCLKTTIASAEDFETLKGDKGDTPYIGNNGNWFVGDEDTGVSVSNTPLEDNLKSTSVTSGLTANQGRVLNERVVNIENKSIRFQSNGNQILKIATVSWDYGASWQECYATLNILGCSNESKHQSVICNIKVQTSNNSDISFYGIDIIAKRSYMNPKNFYIEYKNATKEGEKTVVNVYLVCNNNSAYKVDVISNNGWNFLTKPEIVTIPTDGWTGKYPSVQTNTYLTEEEVVGTWINGKPIYRIVFEKIVGITDETYIGMLHNVEKIIDIRGSIEYVNGYHSLGAYANDNYYSLVQYNVSNQVFLYTKENSGYAGKTATIILEYTKTTD